MATYSRTWGDMPTAGALNQRIEIVRPVTIVNENGYPIIRDVRICSVWASVSYDADSVKQEAGTQVQSSVLQFVIRHRADICRGMAVLFEGRRYEVVALNEFDFKKHFLGIKAESSGVMGV